MTTTTPLLIPHLPNQFQQILDTADDHGIVRWVYPRRLLELAGLLKDGIDSPLTLQEQRKLADHMFRLLPVYTADAASDAMIKALVPTISPHPLSESFPQLPAARRQVILSAQAGALFGLPGYDSKGELDTVRGFFRSIKDGLDAFYVAHADDTEAEAQFMFVGNNRPLDKSLYLAIHGDVADQHREILYALQEQLQHGLNTDPVLDAMNQHIRLHLVERSPHAWLRMDDNCFYPEHESPSWKRLERASQKRQEQYEPESDQPI